MEGTPKKAAQFPGTQPQPGAQVLLSEFSWFWLLFITFPRKAGPMKHPARDCGAHSTPNNRLFGFSIHIFPYGPALRLTGAGISIFIRAIPTALLRV